MKKTACILLALLGLLPTLFLPPAQAKEEESSLVRVGYFDYEGFLERDPAGNFSGYGYEYLEEIASYTGWEYEFVPGSWEQCLQRLANREIDLLCTAQYSEQRAQLFDYAQYETGIEYAALFVNQDNNTVFYHDYESYNGLTVGFMQDSYQNELFARFAQEHGFTYQSAYYPSALELERALDRREIDAMLTGSLQKISGKKVAAKFSPEPFYFITYKGNGALLRQLNEAMEEILTANVNFNAELYQKYYGDSSTGQFAFTQAEASFLAAHPVLRVAYNKSWNPVCFWDSRTREFKGICAGLLQLMSERNGIQFEFIPADSELQAAQLVQLGEADILCCASSHLIQDARKSHLLLTKPLFEVPITVSKPSYLAFEDIATIAVPGPNTSLAYFAQERFPQAEILRYPDLESCMNAVLDGRADAVAETVYTLDQYRKHSRYSDLEPILSARAELPIRLGVNSTQDPVLRSLLNKMISQIDARKTNEIVIATTMEGPRIHAEALVKQYIMPTLALLFFLVLVIVLQSRKRIKRYAFTDPVTGCKNETSFLLSTKKVLHSRGYEGYALASLDIDKFKLINNMHSFETGNRVLQAMSAILLHELRPNEVFCREGGDHFILLVRDSSQSSLNERMDRLLFKLSGVPRSLGVEFQYTISCGVYPLQEADSDLHRAIGWASLARKKAKAQHSNSICYYDDSMRKEVLQEQEIANRMESALQNGEFHVYYQPKFCLASELPVGAEALARWTTGDGHVISPSAFIPVFENNGFIVRLDLYIFEQVCRQLRHWLNAGLRPYPVSVNLSRVHLSHPAFHLQYIDTMRKYDIPTQLIEIELTESAIFENKTQMVTLITELKNSGLTVSMDDFGSGYSSLNLLKDMPIDYLKLDKEFFNRASDSERGKKIIESVIFMAKKLGITVIAEGVEEQDQVDFLRAVGCDIVQGYFYSTPKTPEDFRAFLEASMAVRH